MPRALLALLAAVALTAAASASAATGSRIPAPVAPGNPFLAQIPYSNIHNDTWMTDAYAQAGPRPGNLKTQFGPLSPSLCSAMVFDTKRRIVTICPSAVAAPEVRMIDPKTLTVLGHLTLPAGGPPPPGTKAFQNFTGGGYFYLDRKNHITTATKTNHIFVMGETSAPLGFKVLRDYDLTGAVTGDERITSALPDFQGRIWFVSKKDGKVGVLNTKTGRYKVTRTGEEIENSFAVGKDGVYIVSDKRMYRWNVNRHGRPVVTWKSRYRNSGIVKPSQVDAGSGTTPTIMAGGYVAITDNADPMNVVVYRTAARLKRGLRRVVCQVPVFGRGASATENSLSGAGRSLIVENNYGYEDPLSGTKQGTVTKPGFARIDVKRDGRGCRKIWTNTTVHAPTVVPKLSTKTQILYTYEQDASTPLSAGGVWSWVGISARTGKQLFKVHAGDGAAANNNYAGIGLGPDGSAYLGTIGGVRKLSNGG